MSSVSRRHSLKGSQQNDVEVDFASALLIPETKPNLLSRLFSPYSIILLMIPCYVLLVLHSVSRPVDSVVNQLSRPAGMIVTDIDYQGLHQDDTTLIGYIKMLLIKPSIKPYHLSMPWKKHFTSIDESKFVGQLYGSGKRDGFFLDVGALDGEESSSTLYLERELGFTGLLIEPNPANFKRLLTKQRKAYTLKAALSHTTEAAQLLFTGTGKEGHLTTIKTKWSIPVKAFPIYSILRAVNVSFVDVLNLDVEGFELKILRTIPFDRVKFGICIIEHLNIQEPKADLLDFMADVGYHMIHENGVDYIFGDLKYLQNLPGWQH